MLINVEAYEITKKLKVAEIPGPVDHPWVKLAHNLCGISGHDVDAKYAWCSSGMNMIIAGVCLKRNPGRVVNFLLKKGHSPDRITEFCNFFDVTYTTVDNGVEIALPKFSASAYSWTEYGGAVPFSEAKRADLLVFVRKDWKNKVIGHHISFLDADSLGKVFAQSLGCNQSNMICSSNKYLRMNLIAVRRARL